MKLFFSSMDYFFFFSSSFSSSFFLFSVWSVTSLNNMNSAYERTNMLTDTVVVATTDPKFLHKAGNVLDEDRNKHGKAEFGYVLWLSDNIVFDRAGNSFAGSDMDADGLIFLQENESSSNIWMWILISVVCFMVFIGGCFIAKSLCGGGPLSSCRSIFGRETRYVFCLT